MCDWTKLAGFFLWFFFFPTICSVSCCPWRHGYPLLNYAALPREWLCSSICILQYSLPFLPVYVDFHTTDVIRKLHLSLSCYFEQGNCDMSLKTQERICTANQSFRNWIHRITNFSKAVLLSVFSSPPLFSFEQNDFSICLVTVLCENNDRRTNTVSPTLTLLLYRTPLQDSRSAGSAAIRTFQYA